MNERWSPHETGRLFLGSTLAILLISSVGCIGATYSGFPKGDLATGAGWPPQARGPTSSLSIIVDGVHGTKSYECGLWGFVPYAPWTCSWSWYEETKAIYNESGLFSRIGAEDGGSDGRVHVSIQYKYIDKGSMGAAFVIWTGIPFVSGSETITATTTIRNAGGEVIGSVTRSSTLDIWMHLLMPLLYPFKGSGGATLREMYRDLLRATIVEAHGEGVF